MATEANGWTTVRQRPPPAMPNNPAPTVAACRQAADGTRWDRRPGGTLPRRGAYSNFSPPRPASGRGGRGVRGPRGGEPRRLNGSPLTPQLPVPRSGGEGKPILTVISAITLALAIVATSGCNRLRLPAIDPTGACIFAPLPTTTPLALPCTDGSCCLPNLNPLSCNCLSGLTNPVPAFAPAPELPDCLTPAAIGSGAAAGAVGLPDEPCVPAPSCAECAAGPKAVLIGSEIGATKKCNLPPKGKRGCILLSPQKIVAPVGGEVMLLSGICGDDGHLQTGQPLDWMLTGDSVGNIIDIGDDDPGLVHRLVGVRRSEKQDGAFARGVTSFKEQLITRGNLDASDDVKLERGQTWLTLSSPTEGSSHVTVLAPESECWDQRKATATIYWVDARWQFPGPQRVPAGTAVNLVTRVTRAAGSLPARGWKVRYEITNPELATFAGTDGSSIVEVNVDDSGNAPATLRPMPTSPPPSGSTIVNIEVIRPGGATDSMPDLSLGRGQAFVTWSSPELVLRAGGPSVAGANEAFDVFANIQNPGTETATSVRVDATIPQGVRVLSADSFAKVFPNQVVWEIGDVPAGQQLDLRLQLTSAAPLAIGFEARGDGGLVAGDTVRVDVFAPAITLIARPDVQRITTGDVVNYTVEVQNSGDRPLNNLTLVARGDDAMQHAETGNRQVTNGYTQPLPPGGLWRTEVAFRPLSPGQRCVDFTATADGGQRSTAQSCVVAINPAPQVPAVESSLVIRAATIQNGAPVVGRLTERIAVGDAIIALAVIENSGRVPLTNVEVAMSYGPAIEPITATVGVPRVLDPSGRIVWTLANLAPGASQSLEGVFRGVAPAPRTDITVAVNSDQRATSRQSLPLVVDPSAGPVPQVPTPRPQAPPLPPPPARTPPPVLPPTAAGQLRLDLVSLDLLPQPGRNIRYALSVINNVNVIDSAVQVYFRLPPGVRLVQVIQTTDTLSRFDRQGDTIYLQEIRTLRPGDKIDFQIVLASDAPQTFELAVEATSRNAPQPARAAVRTEVR